MPANSFTSSFSRIHLKIIRSHTIKFHIRHFILYCSAYSQGNLYLASYTVSANGFSELRIALRTECLRYNFEIQTTWQVNWKSFNVARDWSQLCILSARHSYIRQYGKMASGPYGMVWSDADGFFFFCGDFVKHSVYVIAPLPASNNDTTRAQHTDRAGLYKKWPWNSSYAWQVA